MYFLLLSFYDSSGNFSLESNLFIAITLLFFKKKIAFISYCYFFSSGYILLSSLSFYDGFLPSFIEFNFPEISINLINFVKIPSIHYLI